ncbi:MAG: VOC family protein [Bacteroidetes bacterium]|nr:VOC family protein [Bacteroidota bacterium]
MANSPYTCLWFSSQAEEAAKFYCSVFQDSKLISSNPMLSRFELRGSQYMALNGAEDKPFNESFSIVVECDTQDEIDHYWEAFSDQGTPLMCGWIRDKYGVCWQIVPSRLSEWMSEPEKGKRVIEAFLKMTKFIIAELENA